MVNYKLIVGIVAMLAFVLSSCTPKEVTCNSPYIKVGTSCCLDQNSNNICDNDEIKDTSQKIESIAHPNTTNENNATNNCLKIIDNDGSNQKINLFVFEDGFNSNLNSFDSFLSKELNNLFVIEPYKSTKTEFNVYRVVDLNKEYNCSNCNPFEIENLIKNMCFDYSTSKIGLILIVYNKNGWNSGSSSGDYYGNDFKLSSSKFIFVSGLSSFTFPHELAHTIGFLDDEYDNNMLYLGGLPYNKNIDSVECKKWCQGVNKESLCYSNYEKWLKCFSKNFIDNSNEMKEILSNLSLEYNNLNDISWWGLCFNKDNHKICGSRIVETLHHELFLEKNPTWIRNWDMCKQQNLEAISCDIGYNCRDNQGCFTREGLATTIPSQNSIMRYCYSEGCEFNSETKNALNKEIMEKDGFEIVDLRDNQIN